MTTVSLILFRLQVSKMLMPLCLIVPNIYTKEKPLITTASPAYTAR